ncbi:tripartite tricarboxylate transporter substrate binding protein [Variovorax sp. EL159]|uniref:Bug family tripartite tricarboxylate transporter substrate binding protein n=1 Tax=Variovorax sp. EL159 TaxID=1566270 RepID=UPI000884CBDC|nr:tripartite tricarboxylate transporter substrate binding protein [Variovorax sp. EL159]SCX56402.1 Tripartite-type tricarboxylate transporter, receptor component TctC [Variovorax sp. EL159]
MVQRPPAAGGMNDAPGITRRNVLSALALAAGGTLAGGLPRQAWAAEAWPTKPLRIIVPFAPGGGADGSARVLAEVLAPQLGQAVVVENKPGAGSAIGVAAAAQSRDGHTLLMGSNSMVINPVLNPKLSYDVARDFDAIGMVSRQPLVLVVPADSKAMSVGDLIAQAKAQPGRLSAGNSGTGTLAHLTAELFSLETGTSLVSVPYKGESALMPDLISGLVSMGFLNLPSVIIHIRSGRLRALAVSSPQPVPELTNVPTFRSLKLQSLEVEGWATLVAPKGTIPNEGLARLEKLLASALQSDVVKKRFDALSLETFTSGREATAEYLKAEGNRWSQVVKTRGIRLES